MKYLNKTKYFFALAILLFSSIQVQAVCPSYAGSEQITEGGVTYDVLYFGTSTDFPGSAETGSPTDPLLDWNSSNGGVDATNDCSGNIYMKFLGCYFNTDNEFGDINYTLAPSQNNVILDGQGAVMENLAASSSFIRCDGLDNWTIRNFTFTGWNQNAILLTDMTNTTVENCIFDSNPTQRAVRVDNDDNASDVTFDNCIFSNNPPVSETPSTGAVEVREDEFAGPLVVNFNNCDFDCNARQGFGGGALWISPVSFPSNNGPEVNITGGSFVNNFSGTDTGDGGAIGINGEDSFLDIDGTLFSCNYSEASTGDGGGGAIRIQAGPTVTIDNSTFYGNYNTNSAGSIPAGGYGGAININSSAANVSTLTITNTTFTGNMSSRGGALYLESGIVSLDNVLITGNSSLTDPGGGVNNAGATFTIINTSIAGNSPDDLSGAVTDNGGAPSVTDPGIVACETCFSVPPPGCDASTSDLALTCPFFCSTGTPPAATGDADLTIDMSNFVVPTCTAPLDYTYTFLVLDASGTVVCEFNATDNDTQDPNATPPFSTTIAGTPDGIPDAMDPAVQQANLCAGLTPGDYTIMGFHYLTADAPPIITPFTGQMLSTIQGYLTNPPTDPVACGALGNATPFTVLEPIEVMITTSCPATPNGTYLADITITGGYPLEAGAGTYTLTTNFGTTTYTLGTPITGQVIPTGQTVDVTVDTDANGANGTTPPGPLCFDCMATIVSEPEPICQACPDIVDGTLSASMGMASVMDICSGDAVTVCVDVDLTNDATAMVEFSNDGGANWNIGTLDNTLMPNTFCFDFTETNATCDAETVTYQAQFNLPSLADQTCDIDAQPIAGGDAVTVNVYPDVAAVANAVLTDLDCGPSLVQDCASFTVTNDFDGNGANPDFTSETGSGDVIFTITNPAAPSALACATTTVSAPYNCSAAGISIDKDDADDTDDTQAVNPNGTATFTIIVTNTGNVALTNVVVSDPLAPNCDMTFPTLAVGAVETYTCTVDNVSAGFTNVADVTGEPEGGGDPVTDMDDSDVTLTAPSITIVKDDADDSDDTQAVNTNGTATFTITVTNTGDVALTNVVVSDPLAPNCDMTFPTLAVGAVETYTCTVDNVSAGFTNVADVTGEPEGGGDPVTDMDDSDVTLTAPSITIVKDDADNTDDTQAVNTNGTATFTITVTNTGDVALTNVVVSDPLAPNCDMTFPTLAVGAVETYTCTVDNVSAGFTNVADVTGEPEGGGDPVTDMDDSDVTLTAPSITIVKDDADNTDDTQAVNTNGTATFTITVTNTGDVALTNVVVSDPLAPNCDMTFPTLAVGAVETYTCTVDNVSAGFTNVADVTGEPEGGGDPVTDMDDSDVTLTATPSIMIDKDDADNTDDTQMVVGGGTATFTITVTNTGDVNLTNVMVSDPLAPNCDMTFGALAIGASETYTCTVDNVTEAFTNTANVTGTPEGGGPDVTDTDDTEVLVDQPSISMDKNDGDNGDDTQQVEVDGTATFTITITNNGMEDLCNVTVIDPDGASCEMTYTDNGGVLAIGDTWTYTCTVENVLMSFVNAATVNAEGCTSGTPVDDTDVSPVVVPSPPSIPTVGEWGLIILGLMMSIVAVVGIRQRAIETA